MKQATGSVLLAAAMLLAPTQAYADGEIAQASCKVNTQVMGNETPKGRTDFSQRVRLSGRLSPVYITTNWFNLTPESNYNLQIVGDDVEDCESDFLIQDLMSTIGGFNTDAFGAGGMRFRSESINLFGASDVSELYLKLTDSTGKTIQCCMIGGQ